MPVVQRAELVRQQNLLLVNFEAHEVEHHCIDPREDRPVPARPCPHNVEGCRSSQPHIHTLDGRYIPMLGLMDGACDDRP